ncbi:unnamed protein product [Periconia digitata]|uniref:Uncharacterized protein n=1 Tax=Periconia digitata TaxID=1303443 RepID=A0A9W4UCY1_9PLEO|nr:unnamed protein product [Periconia digitata]
MQFPTILLALATTALVSATNLECNAAQPQLTEPRVANIVDQLRDAGDALIAVQRNGPCPRIACYGGTGAFICSNDHEAFPSRQLGDIIDSKYKECYGHTPQSWQDDNAFNPAFEWFDDGFRVFVHGSENC